MVAGGALQSSVREARRRVEIRIAESHNSVERLFALQGRVTKTLRFGCAIPPLVPEHGCLHFGIDSLEEALLLPVESVDFVIDTLAECLRTLLRNAIVSEGGQGHLRIDTTVAILLSVLRHGAAGERGRRGHVLQHLD